MLIRLLIFTFIVSTTSLYSQSEFTFGPENNERGYYSIIAENNGDLYLERKWGTHFDNRYVKRELSKYNNKGALTHAIEIKDIEEYSYVSVKTIKLEQGIAHLYYKVSRKDNILVSAQIYDYKDLRMLDIYDLASFSKRSSHKQFVRQDNDLEFEFPLDVVISKDKSKLGIYYRQEKCGKEQLTNLQYVVVDLDREFKLLHEGEFDTDGRSDQNVIQDVALSNDGTLNFLFKAYVKNKEHINKKPAYDYVLYAETGDSTSFIYDINLKEQFLDDLILGFDLDGNVLMSGLLRRKPYGDVTGTFLLGLDHIGNPIYSNKEQYSKREIRDIRGKDDDNIDNDFVTVGIFPSEDLLFIVRQYRQMERRSGNMGGDFSSYNMGGMTSFQRSHSWDYEDVIIEGINPNSGDRMWSSLHQRNHEERDLFSRYFTTGYYEVLNNELVMIYNESIDNIERIRNKKRLKITDLPGNKTMLTIAKVNGEGKINYRQFGDNGKTYLPKDGVLINNKSVFVLKQNKNYKDYWIGKMELQGMDY